MDTATNADKEFDRKSHPLEAWMKSTVASHNSPSLSLFKPYIAQSDMTQFLLQTTLFLPILSSKWYRFRWEQNSYQFDQKLSKLSEIQLQHQHQNQN